MKVKYLLVAALVLLAGCSTASPNETICETNTEVDYEDGTLVINVEGDIFPKEGAGWVKYAVADVSLHQNGEQIRQKRINRTGSSSEFSTSFVINSSTGSMENTEVECQVIETDGGKATDINTYTPKY